jgi:hypothetical protein
LEQFFGQPCLANAGLARNQHALGNARGGATPGSL